MNSGLHCNIRCIYALTFGLHHRLDDRRSIVLLRTAYVVYYCPLRNRNPAPSSCWVERILECDLQSCGMRPCLGREGYARNERVCPPVAGMDHRCRTLLVLARRDHQQYQDIAFVAEALRWWSSVE